MWIILTAGLTAAVVVLLLGYSRLARPGRPRPIDGKKDRGTAGPGQARIGSALEDADASRVNAESAVREVEGRKEALAAEIRNLEKSQTEMEGLQTTLEESIRTLSEREQELLLKIRDLENEIEPLRQDRITEMENAVTARKETALAEIEAWVGEEKGRLTEQLTRQYEDQLSELKNKILNRTHEEFDQILAFLEEVTTGQKSVIEKDIKELLIQRRSAIVGDLE